MLVFTPNSPSPCTLRAALLIQTTPNPLSSRPTEILPPVQIGTPPADFPFQLAGYTDIEPSDFVYAKTPGAHVHVCAINHIISPVLCLSQQNVGSVLNNPVLCHMLLSGGVLIRCCTAASRVPLYAHTDLHFKPV
jgi:hypothetical protein